MTSVAHPWPVAADASAAMLVRAALDTALACWTCADAGLDEEHLPGMVDCIRSLHSCAEVCLATARVFSRAVEDPVAYDLLKACETACRTCAEVCESHADRSVDCRAAADASRRCERACRERLATS